MKSVRGAEELGKIVRDYGLTEVYTFGSRSKEIASRLVHNLFSAPSPSKSDVDIGVRTHPGKILSALERVRLTLDLEDLFEVSRIDLVILSEAEPFLAADIVRGELLYAEDLDAQARYELYVLRRAGDLFPFKKERVRMILEEGAR